MNDLAKRIREKEDRPLTAIEIPEWGEIVWHKPLSSQERLILSARIQECNGDAVATAREYARIVALVLHDKDGGKLFSNEDIPWLQDKNGAALERIVRQVIIIGDAVEQAKKN